MMHNNMKLCEVYSRSWFRIIHKMHFMKDWKYFGEKYFQDEKALMGFLLDGKWREILW